MSKLVKKSIRMPAEVIDFVESQKGSDFSKKLLGIIDDYRYGDVNREKKLQEYELLLESKRKQLREYSSIAMKASRVTQQLGATLSDVEELLEKKNNDTPHP